MAKALSQAQSAKVFRKLKSDQANKVCFDCPRKNPNWTSIPFGVYLCMDCSAVHRRMGTHISFVKSSILDKWNTENIMFMIAGGNAKARQFFKSRGWSFNSASNSTEKYTSRAARLYKAQLEKDTKLAVGKLQEMLGSPQAAAKPAPKKSVLQLDAMQGLADLEQEVLRMSSPPPKSSPLSGASSPTPVAASSVSVSKPKPQPKTNVSSNLSKLAKKPEPKRVVIHVDRKKKEHEHEQSNLVVKRVTLGGKAKRRVRKGRSSLLSTKSPTSKPKVTSSLAASTSKGGDVDDLDRIMAGSLTLDKKKEQKNDTPVPLEKPIDKPQRTREDILRMSSARKDTPKLDKYKNAKSLSSDQYFGRNQYAPNSQEEKDRLASFSGSSAISSDAFFGREEAEEEDAGDSIDINDLTQSVLQKGQALKNAASSFMSQLRYG